MSSTLLGAKLVESGIISRVQLEAALLRQHQTGDRLASICLALGFADECTLAQALGRVSKVPFLALSSCVVPLSALEKFPGDLAKLYNVLPVRHVGSELHVAMADPNRSSVLDELRFTTGADVLVGYGSLIDPLRQAIDSAYQLRESGQVKHWFGRLTDPSKPWPEDGHLEIVGSSSENTCRSEPPDSMAFDIDFDSDLELEKTSAPFPDTSIPGKTVVLVVDDDDALRKMLCDYLKKSGYEVWEAADGRQALTRLQSGLPQALVLDAMLPGVHGFDICRMVKQAQATRHIPVIMVSAIYRGGNYQNDVRLLYGASAFIEKPLRLQNLKQVLENCLSEREAPPPSRNLLDVATSLVAEANAANKGGDLHLAASRLEKAILVAPFYPSLHHRLALTYIKLKQNYRAISHLEHASQLQPSYVRLVLLSQCYEKVGFTKKAAESWEQTLRYCQNGPESAWIHQHIAELLK